MKILSRFLVVSALLAAVQSVSAFEGKVTLAMTAERGGTMNMDYAMKGEKLRMDMNGRGHQAAVIMDTAKMEMLMLMPEQQMYMVMPMKKTVDQAMEKAGANTTDVEATGKTETILGYKCNQLLVKDKGNVTELWVAEGLGTFMGMSPGGPMGGGGGGMFGRGKPANAAKWEQVLKDKGGFPLRMITRDASGKEISKMEATKIEPGSLPDSMFNPPAGYQKFDMPNMGGLLKGMGGN
jgi:hypothetical protein